MLVRELTSKLVKGIISRLPVSGRENFFERLYQKLQKKGFKMVDKVFYTPNPNVKEVYVLVGWAIIAKTSVSLGTAGISTCSALKIVDPSSNLHYVLHAAVSTKPIDIENSLRKAQALGMNLKKSEIEIMPGYVLSSISTPHILEALYIVDPSLIGKVSLIHVPEDITSNLKQSLVSYNGKTYLYPETFGISELDGKKLMEDGYEVVLSTN